MKKTLTFASTLLFAACASTGGVRDEVAPENGPEQDDGQSYSDVITEEAVTDSGLFHVHRVEDKYYYEIPDSLLGRDMLLVSRIARTPANLSPFINAGSKRAEQMVRWDRREESVLLRRLSYQNVAADSLPISISVERNNFEPIIQAFDIETVNDDSTTVVIEITDLFTDDVAAISGLSRSQRSRFQVRRLDGDRTFIDYARSYPLNVEVGHTLTYDAAQPPSAANTGTISMQMNQSMIVLPEEPMTPRLSDPRVGWFTVTQVNYGLDEQKAAERSYLRRWRVEPSDPEAYARGELVDPVEPIVYYVDPATPERWRPYVMRGIEDWQAAFESAGFSNAIIAREAPSPEEDPEFSLEDVRHSAVRWVASTTRNAVGPSVSDPRSGEIIESDIIWYHNHMRSYRNRLMIETGASNPRARSLMLDEEVMGEAMRAVIAHEVGHALGLPHNMIASSSYPVDSLRSPSFAARMGVAPTIMDYARQNYIAQPEDGVTRFIRKIGPYDHYAIEWGYRVIPGAETPEDELEVLDRWILEHSDNPMYRFGSSFGVDPRAQTEDLGDDPVRASTYAIQNLQRVLPNLIEWTSTDGEGYEDLEEIYGEFLGQWSRYIGHVVTVIGGVHQTLKTADQEGPVYVPTDAGKQREAMAFLREHMFQTPQWLLNENVLDRIEHSGAVDRIRSLQVRQLNRTLDPRRMQRLIETEVFHPEGAYSLLEFMTDVKDAVWGELSSRGVIDPFRRNLQRAYLERMEYLMTEDITTPTFAFFSLTPVDVSQSDIRPFVRGTLSELRGEVQARINRTRDRATVFHLRDVLVRIDDILDPGNE